MLMATERRDDLAEVLPDIEPLKWCMIAVKPGKEQECCDSFRRAKVRCYWPNYHIFERRLIRRAARRPARDYRAVIPGYLFTPLPRSVAFYQVLDLKEGFLHSIHTFSGDVFSLDNEAIMVLRKIEAGLNTPKPKASLHNFKTGEKVRFADDLLSRWPPGKVARLADDGRIVVETEVMGRLVPFLVFPYQLERL
jgi:transcription antitermination factor NusG